jgi:hypothetical protein
MEFRVIIMAAAACAFPGPAAALSIYNEVMYQGEIWTNPGPNYSIHEFPRDANTPNTLTEELCVDNSGLTTACTPSDISDGAQLSLNASFPFDFYFGDYADNTSYYGSINIHSSVGQTNIDSADVLLDFDYYLSADEAFRADYVLQLESVSLGNDCYNWWSYQGTLFGNDAVSGSCDDGLVTVTGSRIFNPGEAMSIYLALYTANDQFIDAPGVATNISLDYTITAVPLPAAVWLLGSALASLVGWQTRRKTNTVFDHTGAEQL